MSSPNPPTHFYIRSILILALESIYLHTENQLEDKTFSLRLFGSSLTIQNRSNQLPDNLTETTQNINKVYEGFEALNILFKINHFRGIRCNLNLHDLNNKSSVELT